MNEIYSEKDNYFIRKIYFLEEFGKGLESRMNGDYIQSNKIYIGLLDHIGDKQLEEWLENIFSNIGWNCIELGNLESAKDFFQEAIAINPCCELAVDGLKNIIDLSRGYEINFSLDQNLIKINL